MEDASSPEENDVMTGGLDMVVPNARDLLRRYFLGESTDEENHKIEERSLDADDYSEWMLEIKHELIAAYVSGELTLRKRERFENYFLRSEERLEQLRLAELLYECVKAGATMLPDASDPLYGYFLGDLAPDEELKIRERLLVDSDYKRRFESAEHAWIAAYTLENLTKDERERFERYFSSSEEGLKKLRFAEALYQHYRCGEMVEAPEGVIGRRLDRLRQWLAEPVRLSVGYRNLSRPAWQPLTAFSLICLGAFIWALFLYKPPITRGLNIFRAEYAQERPVEARLTGFGYATYRPSQNEGVVELYHDKRDEALGLIVGQAIDDESAAAYHALGTAYLVYRDIDRAVDRFEIALQKNEGDAKLHNDLAVALMEREKAQAKNPGQSTGEDAALALEHLHRAIKLNPSLLEAYFNLALCHQYQTLWRMAEEDWNRYLEKDSASPWAEEARKNLAKIAEKIKQPKEDRENIYQDFLTAYRDRNVEQAWGAYKQSRIGSGSFVANRLIDNYLSLSGKSAEAEDSLSALVFIGNIELDKVRDRFTHDLAQVYRSASAQQLRKLSAARRLFAAGTERLKQSQVSEAINHYQPAIALFNEVGDVCESLVAQSLLGHCYFQQASAALSLPVLTQGQQECESRNYLWLRGMFLNGLANVNVDLTKYSAALDYSLNQLALAKRVEDKYGVLQGINRVTDTYLRLARYQDMLPMIQEGLSVAGTLSASQGQIAGLHAKASRCHLASGKLIAALDYATEAFKLSLETNNPWVVSRYQAHLGVAYHKLGNHAEAIRLIRESGEIGKRLQGEKMGKEIATFSHLRLAEIYREIGDLDSALNSYEGVLQLYGEQDINKEQLRFEAKKGILLTHIKRGDDAAAEAVLKEVIDLYEQHRQNIEDENSRNTFFDSEQGIYDIAIGFAYFKRQDHRRAFDYCEMSRARSLLDAVSMPSGKLLEDKLPSIRLPRSTQPLDLGQIQSRLPGKTQLLQYSVLNDRLLIWVVSGADLKSYSVEIGREALDNKVSDYLRSLAGGRYADQANDYKARSAELYNLLIKPVESLLDKDAEICIIPDKALNRLPFASLISPTTGKYLIEERVIFTSPSANMFLIASDKARQKEAVQTERLLAVGNPRFDGVRFPGLKDLPWAAAQASEIKTFYPNSIVLLDRYAREQDVRRLMEWADVAHFATHLIADERSPMLSMLPLAGEENPAPRERDGVLQTFEFYSMNLSRLRLVVLSACQTGIERYYKGEGAISLARPFQAAGIPLVIASLWPVESFTSKELMVAFHKHRKGDGLSTAQALRQAQIDMIRSNSSELRNPYNWAAYTIIGGHANF
jgi:CHAT domain-containing protein